jgi:glycerol-3-phosphate dehydrogenase
VFAIPRHEMVIVGTTDTDFSGDPSKAKVTKEDVEYLLNIANRYFPGSKLTQKDIVASYVGVRPLVHDGSENESKTSREHTIIEDDRGFTFVAGGKYTTFNIKAKLKPCSTYSPLNPFVESDAYRVAVQSAQSDLERKLALRYGAEAKEILHRFGVTDQLWMIEAFQAIHKTMCLSLVDFYSRRVPLILSESDHGLKYLDDVAFVFQQELSLTEAEIAKQKSDLMSYIDSEMSWRS